MCWYDSMKVSQTPPLSVAVAGERIKITVLLLLRVTLPGSQLMARLHTLECKSKDPSAHERTKTLIRIVTKTPLCISAWGYYTNMCKLQRVVSDERRQDWSQLWSLRAEWDHRGKNAGRVPLEERTNTMLTGSKEESKRMSHEQCQTPKRWGVS